MINKKIIHRKFFRFFFRDPVPGLYTTLGLTQVDNSSAMSTKKSSHFYGFVNLSQSSSLPLF